MTEVGDGGQCRIYCRYCHTTSEVKVAKEGNSVIATTSGKPNQRRRRPIMAVPPHTVLT